MDRIDASNDECDFNDVHDTYETQFCVGFSSFLGHLNFREG